MEAITIVRNSVATNDSNIIFKGILKEIEQRHNPTITDKIVASQYSINLTMYLKLTDKINASIDVVPDEGDESASTFLLSTSLINQRDKIGREMVTQLNSLGLGVKNRKSISATNDTQDDCSEILDYDNT